MLAFWSLGWLVTASASASRGLCFLAYIPLMWLRREPYVLHKSTLHAGNRQKETRILSLAHTALWCAVFVCVHILCVWWHMTRECRDAFVRCRSFCLKKRWQKKYLKCGMLRIKNRKRRINEIRYSLSSEGMEFLDVFCVKKYEFVGCFKSVLRISFRLFFSRSD